jgi:hypothetical protein
MSLNGSKYHVTQETNASRVPAPTAGVFAADSVNVKTNLTLAGKRCRSDAKRTHLLIDTLNETGHRIESRCVWVEFSTLSWAVLIIKKANVQIKL